MFKNSIHFCWVCVFSTAVSAVENSFLEKQADASGHYVWGNAQNWSKERIPNNQDVVQIGHSSEEVQAYVKSAGRVAGALEIAEHGQSGGETNALFVTAQGTLNVSGLISVGKDKHGILNILGGSVTGETSILVGGYSREETRGTIHLTGGSLSVGTWLYIGGNRFGPKTKGGSVWVSAGAQLNVGERLEVDSTDQTEPGIISLSDGSSLTLHQGEMRINKGVFRVEGGNVQTNLAGLECVGEGHTRLVFAGNGVSKIQTHSAKLGFDTRLDVTGLNVQPGSYVLLEAGILDHQGLFFDSEVDRSMWHLDISSDTGTITLIHGSGPIQHDLRVIHGTGSGMFAAGETVSLVAGAAGQGLVFDRWQGDVQGVEDVFSPNTSLLMGDGSATITAVYRPVYEPHHLWVSGGSGSGLYGMDQIVPLVADAPGPGRKFFRWYGDQGITNPLLKETTYVMPARASVLKASYYQPEDLVGSRGYHCRPCGLDLNRDGKIGVDGEDNILARDDIENPDAPRWDWRDPDGDNVYEDYYFVDAEQGSDSNTGRTRESPLKTIQEALNRCDGAANGKEDIICIHGVFREEINLTQSGRATHYTRDGFEYPADPMRIIGWDKDGDGQYPPFDQDDEAVIDGSDGLVMAISNGTHKASYVEIAHLVIQNFNGWSTTRERGAIRLSSSLGGDVSHIYIHDVEMRNINTESYRNPNDPDNTDEGDERIVVVFWNGNTALQHIALSNVLVDGYGDFFARGSPAYNEVTGKRSGKFRFKNLTLNCKTLDGHSITGFKIWGAHDGVEILDSVLDGRPQDWNYINGGPRLISVRPDQHDVTIRNNLLLQGRTSITIDGCSDDFGETRTTDDIVIEGNHIVVTHDDWGSGLSRPVGIRIDPGCNIQETTEDISIRNNFLFMPIRGAVALELNPGMDDTDIEQPGVLEVVGNTIYGPGKGEDFYGLLINLKHVPNPQRNFRIYNNIFTNIGSGGYNISHDYPSDDSINNVSIQIDGNIWDPEGRFRWYGERLVDFQEWKEQTGQDGYSILANPVFAHVGGADLHLAPEDTVARNAGINITGITTHDIDNDEGVVRTAGVPFAGADVQNEATVVTGVMDSYALFEDHVYVVSVEAGVLANDGIDPLTVCDPVNGNPVTNELIIQPSAIPVVLPVHGALHLERDGSFTYIPDANYHGNDTFTYRIRDPFGRYSRPIAVSLSIQPVNDSPQAAGDSFAVYLNHPLNVPSSGVLANDYDVEGDNMTAVLVDGPRYAEDFVLRSDGSFRYVPEHGAICVDRFTYVASDGHGNSHPVVVVLTVGNAPIEIVVDNQDAATSRVGNWEISNEPPEPDPSAPFIPYQADARWSKDADASFSWHPDIPITSVYRVYAWWAVRSTRGTKVPYVITHEGEEVAKVYVNQRKASTAGKWIFLGEFSFTGGAETSISVLVENNHQACADAIRLVRTGYPVPGEIIVDNLSPNTSGIESGLWTEADEPLLEGAYLSNYAFSDKVGAMFEWSPVLPADGKYGVYIWWTHFASRSSQVPCKITQSGSAIASVTLNQADVNQAGRWIHLGDYQLLAGTASVQISVDQSGSASADAVRFVRIYEDSDDGGSSGTGSDEFKIESYCFHSDGRHVINIRAKIGVEYTLQVSRDLQSWEDVETRIGVDPVMVFQIESEEPERKLFYRVKKVEAP